MNIPPSGSPKPLCIDEESTGTPKAPLDPGASPKKPARTSFGTTASSDDHFRRLRGEKPAAKPEMPPATPDATTANAWYAMAQNVGGGEKRGLETNVDESMKSYAAAATNRSFGPYPVNRQEAGTSSARDFGNPSARDFGNFATGRDFGGQASRPSARDFGASASASQDDWRFGTEEHRREAARETREKLNNVVSAAKVIRIKISYHDDIIQFNTSLDQLRTRMHRFFPDESDLFKILVLMQCVCDTTLKIVERVFQNQERENRVCFDTAISDVFEEVFPSNASTLRNLFGKLTQAQPDRLTVPAYGEKFRHLAQLLGYDLRGYYVRWIDGLTNVQVKEALRRTRVDALTFSQLIELAVSIEGNLSIAKKETETRVYETHADSDDDLLVDRDELMAKIFDNTVGQYLRRARESKIGNRCWNCFSSAHKSTDCRMRSCKFCDRLNKEAKHLSLLCPKAPKDLSRLLEVRETKKASRAGVRFADEYDQYHFESDELSDS